MVDFDKLVKGEMERIVSSGKLEQMIHDQLESTVKDILKDALRSYSPFGKSLKEHLETNLKLDFQEFNLSSYNDLILKIIKKHFDSCMAKFGVEDMQKKLDELLGPPADKILLSKLVESMMEDFRFDADHDGWVAPTVIIKGSNYDDKSCHIYLDPEEGKQNYSCSFSIFVYEGRVASVSVKDIDIENKIFLGDNYGFARKLISMYSNKPELVVDEDSGFYYREEY